MREIREKPPVQAAQRKKAKILPKTLIRNPAAASGKHLRTQLRDAAQRGQQDDVGGDRLEDTLADGAGAVVQDGAQLTHRAENAALTAFRKRRQKEQERLGAASSLSPEGFTEPDGAEIPVNHVSGTSINRSETPGLSDGTGPIFPVNADYEARAGQPAPARLPRERQTTEENRFRIKERFCHRTIREKEQSPAYLPKERRPIPDAPRTEPQAPPVSSASAFATERATQQTAQRAAQQARKTSQAAAKTASATGQTARSAGDAVRRTAAVARTALASSKSLSVVIAVGGGVVVAILLVVLLFGGAFSLVGGDNVSSVLPVSEEVEAYEPVIQLYAEEYGVADYVELILAIMMQESGGRGLDPMQASESGYNTRYPNTPGGITDPDYSIQCGVQVVRDVLERAGVESPVDMEHIRLALQGYNFGPGYITWAVRHYGGYSLANAAEFSAMMAEQLGWDGYGDTQYVPHVLRYYVFGRFGTGEGNETLVAVALSQEGNGGETYWRWFGFDSRVDWCACFVSWCADQCGLIDAGTVPKFSLCTDGAAWFADQGRLMDGSYVPSAGDIIFFDWDGDGNADHVGIVETVSGGRVYTVEGNSGDTVRRKDYALGGTAILGFGVLGQ